MLKSALPVLVTWALSVSAAHAAVRIIVGPTPIIDGEARASHDLTVVNEKLAFAFAVDTPPPYGVPRGAVIDVAPVREGKIGRDRAVFADFIPNDWSGWPNSVHRLDVIERGPRRAVIRTVRDWGEATLTTVYTLVSGSDHVILRATLHNGGKTALVDLLSGFTLWPKGGYLFGVPGLRGAQRGPTTGALADRMVAYDRDWSIALHAPYVDHIDNGSRDMFRLHTLGPGASRTFEAWLQVGDRGDLAPVVAEEIARKSLASGRVLGAVTDAGGRPVEQGFKILAGQDRRAAMSGNFPGSIIDCAKARAEAPIARQLPGEIVVPGRALRYAARGIQNAGSF